MNSAEWSAILVTIVNCAFIVLVVVLTGLAWRWRR